MELKAYLESPGAIERDAAFCGIDAKSRTLIRLAADEVGEEYETE